jgi:beta-lactamase regulating signal transducer with metallopeptidase domain
LWRLLAKPMQCCSARTRAEILFAMRVGPPAIAVILVSAFLVPSYLVYEPYSTYESVSKKLGALAMVSALGVALALWRGIRSWLATRSLRDEWLTSATPIELSEVEVPSFRIPHSFPIIAVVGAFKPRLFIADRVLQNLNKEQLVAAIAHECGHLTARDNFKRTLIRVCRDLLLTVPCGRSIDRAWADNAEAAADEHAAQQNSDTALNLASALIEIARMVPAGSRPRLPAGAFILGDETSSVKGRVKRLIALAGTSRPLRPSVFISRAIRVGLAVLLTGLIGTLTGTHSLAALHVAMERVVQLLT